MNLGTILVVDDDESILAFLEEFFNNEGYNVVLAQNGKIALNCVQQTPVDLILLDMRMPVLDGWQFLEAYKDFPKPHAPVIAFSAQISTLRKLTDDVIGFIEKPFDAEHLLGYVDEILADYLFKKDDNPTSAEQTAKIE